MNGQFFDRYKLKLIHENHILITDGFKVGPEIVKGDIIENMEVIGHISDTKLCKLYYQCKGQEELAPCSTSNYKREVERKTIKPKAQKENLQLNIFSLL